jgi:hypothetical protein
MKIGAALLLLAVGAILRFAIAATSTHGVNVHTIGDILMIVGAIGLILWLIVWAPRSRSRGPAYSARPPLEDEQPPVTYRRQEQPPVTYRRDGSY